MTGIVRRRLSELLVPAIPMPIEPATDAIERYGLDTFASGMPSIIPRAQIARGAQLVEPGDVLCSRSMETPRRAWVVGPCRGRAQVATRDWLVLRPAGYDPSFLRHLLVSNDFLLRAAASASSARVRTLRAADVAGIDIPVPPLVDQERLGRAFDQVQGMRGKRAALATKLATFAPALLREALAAVPAETATRMRLKDALAPTQELGASVTAAERDDVRLVRALHIASDGEIIEPESHSLASALNARPRGTIRAGDVLLALGERGSGMHAAVAHPGAACWSAHEDVCRLRFDPARLHSQFACALIVHGQLALSRPGRRSSLDARVRAVLDAEIRLPPLAAQRRCADILAAARALQLKMRRASRRLDDLLGALRDAAFRGALN